MKVTLSYEMTFKHSDLFPKSGKQLTQGWVIRKVVKDERGTEISSEDVAIFNFDSEAMFFQRFLYEGSAVTLSDDSISLFALQNRNAAQKD